MVNGIGKYYENDDNGNVFIAKQSHAIAMYSMHRDID